MEEHVDLFESDEEEEPADPKLDGVVGFVLDKLAAFGERLEGLETKVGKLEQQQTPPPASKMAKMASIFGPGTSMTSTPMATEKPRAEAVFKPPETPDDVQDEQLRAALKDVWLPGPRSRTELLTDAQQRYVCYFLAHAGPATGKNSSLFYV